MTTPDHAENTGDNLRHAAEVTHPANEDGTDVPPEDRPSGEPQLPDFNT